MKTLKRTLVMLLLPAVALVMVACSKTEKPEHYSSYVPPETAEMGDAVKLDEDNILTFQKARLERTEKGDTILIVRYDWQNTSKAAHVSEEAFTLTAKQDGINLKPDLSLVEDRKKLVTNIPGGDSIEGIEQGFVLRSEDPVTLVLTGRVKYIFVDEKPQFNHPVKLTVDAADLK